MASRLSGGAAAAAAGPAEGGDVASVATTQSLGTRSVGTSRYDFAQRQHGGGSGLAPKLLVKIIKAENLPLSDCSHRCVAISIGALYYTTQGALSSAAPTWDDAYALDVPASRPGEVPPVRVAIIDKYSYGPNQIGTTSVPVSKLAPGIEVIGWYPVSLREQSQQGSVESKQDGAPRILVAVTSTSEAVDSGFISDYEAVMTRAKIRRAVEDVDAFASGPSSVSATPINPESRPRSASGIDSFLRDAIPNQLLIFVRSVSGLTEEQVAQLHPYLKLHISSASKHVLKSSVLKSLSQMEAWREGFGFPLKLSEEELQLVQAHARDAEYGQAAGHELTAAPGGLELVLRMKGDRTLSVRNKALGELRVPITAVPPFREISNTYSLNIVDKHATITLSVELTVVLCRRTVTVLGPLADFSAEVARAGILVEGANAKQALSPMAEDEGAASGGLTDIAANVAAAAASVVDTPPPMMTAGDYLVQVHIIQARDLKAKDADGLSDPVVYVGVRDQSQHTSVHHKTLSCVFDDLLFFNLPSMSLEELDDTLIDISVFDADTAFRNEIIGSYQFDLSTVYQQPHHEFYEQWVGVVGSDKAQDTGIQGYLQVTVVVLGPGDARYVHDPNESNKADGPTDSMILLPPAIQQQPAFVVLTVYQVKDMPPMDFGLRTGIDAYVRLSLGATKDVSTSIITVRGNKHLAAEFLQSLWLPLQLPCNVSRVTIAVMDHDAVGRDDHVGSAYFRIDELLAEARAVSSNPNPWLPASQKGAVGPLWIPIYGGAVSADAVANLATTPSLTEAADKMAKYPNLGSTYRGSMLVALRMELRPETAQKPTPHRCTALPLADEFINATSSFYTLQVQIVMGSNVPKQWSRGIPARVQPVFITASVGPYSVHSEAVSNQTAMPIWKQTLVQHSLHLPTSDAQIPDLFLYLSAGKISASTLPMCFVRFTAAEALKRSEVQALRWVTLQPDSSVGSLSSEEFPGAILCRFRLVRQQGTQKVDPPAHWGPEVERLLAQQNPAQLRVHIFQARNLPPADDNGLSDPFLTVHYAGQQGRSDVKMETVNPIYYQSVCLDVIALPSEIAPPLVIEAWDWDRFSANDLLGVIRVPLAEDCKVDVTALSSSNNVPNPRWHALMNPDGTPGTQGEVLLSVQLVLKMGPTQELPPPVPIAPPFREAYLEVIVIGVRNLLPSKFMPVFKPWVQFKVATSCHCNGTCNRCRPYSTQASKSPNAANANFLQRLMIPIWIPESSLYLPSILVRALDSQFIIHTSLVGVGNVSLSRRVPWCSDYVRPRSQLDHDANAQQDLNDFAGAATVSGAGEAKAWISKGFGAAATAIMGVPKLATYGTVRLASGAGKLRKLLAKASIAEAGAGGTDAEAGEAKPLLGAASASKPPADSKASGGATNSFELQDVVSGSNVTQPEPEVGHDEGALKSKDAPIDAQPVVDADDVDEIPAYMKGRRVLTGALEDELPEPPFESFSLYRGQSSSAGVLGMSLNGAVRKQVGIMKAMVRVVPHADAPPLIDLGALFTPRKLQVRLYVLRGIGLQPMDDNGLSDPYVKLLLGKKVVSGRDKHLSNTVNPEFFQVYELAAKIPGDALLTIQVWDHDYLSSDDLIGSTTIDLEDRWFDKRWKALGHEADDGGGDAAEKLALKPVERRLLKIPSSTASRGTLECWIDILTATEAKRFPPLNIAPPPPEPFEVRVIIWKTKEVIDADPITGGSDLFVRCWLEGQSSQQTDCHYRCRNGAGSFNWRMKFPVSLPMKFPQLHIQLWDRDLFSTNDCLGETVLDLSRPLRIALKRKTSYSVYAKDPFSYNAKTTPRAQAAAGPQPAGDSEGGLFSVLRRRGGYSKLDDGKEEAPPKAAANTSADTKETVNLIRDKLGIGTGYEPDDGTWLSVFRTNPETHASDYVGSVLVSIEVVPMAQAESRPAGFGRSAPNMNPTLPEPVGRLKLELCGPKLCTSLLVVAVLGVIVMAAPLLGAVSPFLNILFTLPGDLKVVGLSIFGLLVSCLCVGCCCCCYRVKKLTSGNVRSE